MYKVKENENKYRIGIVPMSAKPFHEGHNSLIKFAAGIELLESLKNQNFVLQKNDIVNVYVSYSSRGVKKVKDPNDTRTLRQGAKKIEIPIEGQSPVFGKDMEYIWDNILTSENLGFENKNVFIYTPNMTGVNSPVKAGFDTANAFKEAYYNNEEYWTDPISGKTYVKDNTIITFYCGLDDLKRYSNNLMESLYGEMFIDGLIKVIAIPRVVSISGTKMRNYICNGDIESLKMMLPFSLSEENKEEIASILTQSADCGYPSTRDMLSLENLIKNYTRLII